MGGSFGLSCSVDWELSEVDLFEVPAICAPFYHYSSVVATVTVHRKYSKTGLTQIQHATQDSFIFNPLNPTNQGDLITYMKQIRTLFGSIFP